MERRSACSAECVHVLLLPAEIVEHQGLLQHVQALLGQDQDPQVQANCLTLLMQVQGVKRLASNKALLYSLINRIKVR